MTEAVPLPLVVKDLSFQYHTRSTPAIQNINLTLQPGQIMLLAGSSGCGKTTHEIDATHLMWDFFVEQRGN